MDKVIMTRKEFRSLGKRDFENGAIKNAIADALNLIPTLEAKIGELEQFRYGHLPSCGGSDPAAHECACGYLQGYAYRELKQKADSLDDLVAKIDSFEAQREGNPQPCLLEFAWNEVIETYNKAKEIK
jgi:hypothetical protein